MRSKFLVGMVLAATVFFMAGCGVKEKKEMKTDKVSANTGRTLEERREAKFKEDIEVGVVTLSKNCLYSSNSDYITQWNREGKKLGRTRKNGYTVETCSDKRLICSKWTTDEEKLFELYSIPIKQTESGEDVLWDKAEKVVSYDCDDTDIVFLCEPYLIYLEGVNTLMRFNLETKETKAIKPAMEVSWFDNSSMMDGQLYLVDEQSGEVYCIRIDDWSSEKLYEKKTEGELYDICIDGQFLYVLTGGNDYMGCKIECYDMEKRKMVGQLSYEKIDMLLQKEGVTKSDVVSLSGGGGWVDHLRIYAYEGRLYLSMLLDGKQEHNRFVLLSCPMEEMMDLRYEREISEWWYENCAVYKDDEGIEYSSYFWEAYEDVYYFTYEDKQEKKEHLMRYHLDTKKWEEVPENDLVYLAYREMGCVK